MRLQINVVTILCRALIGTGRQWTKRILPEHLIPRSPLWSEKLVELLEGQQDAGREFTDAACDALGCIDPRTARKHIHALRTAAAAKLPALAELSAAAPGTAGGPDFLPGTNPFVILDLLWDKFFKTAQERSGSLIALSLRPLLWLGPGFESFGIFHRSCIPISHSVAVNPMHHDQGGQMHG